MKHDCENCAWAQYVETPCAFIKGGTMVVIQQGGSFRCTAGTIAKMDLSGDEMFCSSFREREADNAVQKSRIDC